MGVGAVYSRHSQWDMMIKRGVKLYILGVLVNVFEILLPGFLCGTLFGRWDVFLMEGGIMLFCVDILAFAGLAFVMMGILKKFDLSNKWIIVIVVAMSLIGTFARGLDFGSPILNLFFAHFIGSAGGFTTFSLFNWFIFPVAGLIWGQYFIRAKDNGQFFNFWPVYIIVATVYFYVTSRVLGSGVFSDNIHLYYFMTIIDEIFCIICAHGIIGLCYWIAKFLPDKIIKVFSIMSSNITNIYIAQWFFILLGVIFLVYFFRDLVFTDLGCTIYSIVMLVLSTVVAIYYRQLISRKN